MKTNRYSEKFLHVPRCCQRLLSSSRAVAVMLQQQQFWSWQQLGPSSQAESLPLIRQKWLYTLEQQSPDLHLCFLSLKPIFRSYLLVLVVVLSQQARRRSQCDWHVINGEVAGASHYASTEWKHLRTNLAFTHRGRHTTPPRSSLFCCL